MTLDDIDDVYQIECAGNPHHWTRKILEDCLGVNYDNLVLEDKSHTVLGFAIVSHLVNETHILNIAIRTEKRRQGLGSYFIEDIIERAKRYPTENILLEVRESNRAAIQLYEKHGFKQIGIRKDYYPANHGREHALVLKRLL